MSEKISKFLIRIMLLIYIGLLGLGVFLGTFVNWKAPHIFWLLPLPWRCSPLYGYSGSGWVGSLGRIRLPGPFLTGLVLSLFCLLLNLAWVLYFQIEPTVDFQTFNDTALAIARNERVDMLYIGLFPHILGYSTFLGLMMRLLGESAMLAPVLNVVLTLISGLCIYILCLRWLELKAAAAALFPVEHMPLQAHVQCHGHVRAFVYLSYSAVSPAPQPGAGQKAPPPAAAFGGYPLGLACGACCWL